MINNIKTAFKENFEKLKWMDKQTLELAKEKVDAMTDMIGKIKWFCCKYLLWVFCTFSYKLGYNSEAYGPVISMI